MATDPSQPHDALFRAAFTAPDQAAELLRAFLPKALADALDWPALEHVPATFVDSELRDHHADLLFRTEAGGRQVLVYLLLEHKSADDRWTALQLLRYVVRIWERCRRERPGDGLLPPVLPFVLHHGSRRFAAPRSVTELVDLAGLPEELAALQPQATFVLEDLGQRPIDDLGRLPLGHAALLTLLHLQNIRRVKATARLLWAWRELYRRLADDPGPRAQQLLAQLVSYVALMAQDDLSTMKRTFSDIHSKTETHYGRHAQMLVAEGRTEGRTEGRAEGLRIALRTQIEVRFGAVEADVADRLEQADAAALEGLLRRILAAESLTDLFAE
ncbi:MAG: Rpn family recombination-promoting nuclease/putative transposase [Planctomycetes bacterium]|nr:Rpn family recombination-promoting nuclease/putative transposase [Planctomycetota bacterium]